MKIDRLYIACFKHDVRLARALVASVRLWYPDLPISLIKDETYGPFDTSDIERFFGADLFPSPSRIFGWGFGKLEPLFLEDRQRCLILDSDIVLAGPVIDTLEEFDQDFIVMEEVPPDEAFVERLYFDRRALSALDPDFAYPGFTFNTGQIVATTGLVKREDFDPYVIWGSPPSIRHPDVFRCGEQGLLNYMLMKKAAAGEVTLKRAPFMHVATDPICAEIDLAKLTAASPYRFVIHWCGLKRSPESPEFAGMHRGDIVRYFEDIYYKSAALAPLLRLRDVYGYCLEMQLRQFVRKLPALHAFYRKMVGSSRQ